MALVRDPEWDGPGPGPLIEVPDKPDVPIVESLDPDLVYETRGYYGDETYINELVSNTGRGKGTLAERQKALTTYRDQGKIEFDSRNNPQDTDEESTPEFETEEADAFGRLKVLLSDFGLEGLTSKARELIASGVLDGEAIMFELRDTPEFQTRFKANALRKANNLPELRPSTYVLLERQYRETLKANGLNAELYDQYEDFQTLIAGDVSNAELQRRINNGYKMVIEADPEVVRQMQELYKVTPAQLAQYFLDPKNTLPDLERRAAAATISARGKEQGQTQLGKLTAEDLVNRGYTEAQALAAFKILGESKGIFEEMDGETALTQDQKIGSVFGYDVNSTEQIKKRVEKRRSPFLGGGRFSATTGETSGTTETGLGVAQ